MLTLLRQSESQVFEEIRDFYSIVSLCTRILEIQEEVLIWLGFVAQIANTMILLYLFLLKF